MKNLSIKDLKQVKCSGKIGLMGNCDSTIFNLHYQIYQVSPIISESGRLETVTMPVYHCARCGKPYEVV